MPAKSDITFKVVWEDAPEEMRAAAMEFWRSEGVITDSQRLEERSRQLIIVATDKEGAIIGTSTALKTKVKLLNDNWLYQYRCYISPRWRGVGFDVHLTKASLKVLEEKASLEKVKVIGVFVVVENPNLMSNKINNAAVWRAYRMYFVGFNTKGQPIRVLYFKNARI